MSSDASTIIDAAVRFARSNPELLACARDGAMATGRSVDELLLEAVRRLRVAIEQRELVQLELADQPRLYRSSSVAPSRRTESSV